MKECSVDGCPRQNMARKMCSMHYRRWQRNGDPEARQRLRGLPANDRFWARVDTTGICWLWTGGQTYNGYGRFGVRADDQWLAHRYSWTSLVGAIPDGMQVDHLCRVRACVNPDHLEIVTPSVNSQRREDYKRGL